jgi:hypothetical protein
LIDLTSDGLALSNTIKSSKESSKELSKGIVQDGNTFFVQRLR